MKSKEVVLFFSNNDRTSHSQEAEGLKCAGQPQDRCRLEEMGRDGQKKEETKRERGKEIALEK